MAETLYAADAQGKGGKTAAELVAMHEAGTLDPYLKAQGHATGPHRKLVKTTVRYTRQRQEKAAAVEASTIQPSSLLQHFKGSTSPLVVEYGGSTRRGADFRVLPPLHTGGGTENTWFDHEKFLGDLFQTRSDVQVTGVVHPSSQIEGVNLPRFEGAVKAPVGNFPSSPIEYPASATQPSAVTVRATRAPAQKGMRQLEVAKTLDYDPDPPYVQTLLSSGMQAESAGDRAERRTTPEEPSVNFGHLPGTLSLVARLGKAGLLDVDQTRQLFRTHGKQLADARDAADPGGYLERMADIDTSLVQKIGDYHRALHSQRVNEEAAQARANPRPSTWSAATLRRPRPDELATEDISAMSERGFVVQSTEHVPELFSGTAQVSTSKPVTDYSRKFDPAVHRAEHVQAWAKAVLTGDTDDLDRTSVLVGAVPTVASEDLGKAVRTRARKATTLGEVASTRHSTHVDMSKDMTDGVEGGQNFLYRLAQQHGVDPDEGHAETIMANAQQAADSAHKTAGQRLVGMPARRGSGRGLDLLRRSIDPVSSSRWISMAKERIASGLLGEKTHPLPPLHQGMPAPVAPEALEAPAPDAPPEAHAAYQEHEANRTAIQGEIDTWKEDMASQERHRATLRGTAPTPSQEEAAPYIRGIGYNPVRTAPVTPGTPEEQDSFAKGFRRHRAALIEAYRRSDAADSLFPGGRGNRLAEVALGTAVQHTNSRSETGAAHALGGIQ